MDFNNIIGQKEIIKSLEDTAANGRVAHAYVFSGPKGIGKKTVAKAFSGLLLCNSLNTQTQACGECSACKLYVNGSNPDFRIIEPVDSAIGIDEIRELQSDIIIKPLYSSKKVYIIAEADCMTPQAQSCLLKTLEEPPQYAVLILTTSNYYSLLETIRSRTLKYNFRKYSTEEIKEALKKNRCEGFDDTAFITAYADGVIGTALELAASSSFAALREKTLEHCLKILTSKLQDVFEMYPFFEENKGSIDMVLDIMLLFFRDMLAAGCTGKENILINSDKKDIILLNACKFSFRRLAGCIETIENTRKRLRQNANFQLSIEVMLIKLQEEEV